MNPRRLVRASLVLAAIALLAFAAPASAARPRTGSVNTRPSLPGAPVTAPNPAVPLVGERGPIPAGVRVSGRDIGGLTESEARSVIRALVRPSGLPALKVSADGRDFTLSPVEAFDVDTRALLDQAYAATGPTDLTPRWLVDMRAARSFVNGIVAATDRPGTDAAWSVVDFRLKYTAHVVGRQTDRTTARWAVISALAAEARTGAEQPVITFRVNSIQPRWTDKNRGKAILVIIRDRTLRLYEKSANTKTYKCAVGMPGYPTPTGDFQIVEKRYLPTWVNPAPDGWGKGMPAVIGPGTGNPLGTRALNLNSPGIRIHGTENIGSLGTAASHGCMRLQRSNIEELYELVSVGTPVFIR